MRGLWFIECDIDGRGNKWRIAEVSERAAVEGSYFVATFFVEQFEEAFDVFRDNGSRMVGPFTTEQLLCCVQIAEYVATRCDKFLAQRKPGEARVPASTANGLMSAAEHFFNMNPSWKRINFEKDAK